MKTIYLNIVIEILEIIGGSKSSMYNPNVQECDATKAKSMFCTKAQKNSFKTSKVNLLTYGLYQTG